MKYMGGCHCGRVAFEVDADLDKVIECNCSICTSKGYLLTFVPASKMDLKSVPDDLATYTFNKHAIRHQFCPTCGVASFARAADKQGNDMFAVNVRCLEGVDLQALHTQRFDGRSL